MSKEDIKCGLYITFCVLLCVIISNSWYNFTSKGGSGGLTWTYTLNEKKLCKELRDNEICDRTKLDDKEECIEIVQNKQKCAQTVKKWEEDFNFECFNEIKSYNSCKEKTEECKNDYNQLYKCESKVNRPKWMPLPNIRKNFRFRI